MLVVNLAVRNPNGIVFVGILKAADGRIACADVPIFQRGAGHCCRDAVFGVRAIQIESPHQERPLKLFCFCLMWVELHDLIECQGLEHRCTQEFVLQAVEDDIQRTREQASISYFTEHRVGLASTGGTISEEQSILTIHELLNQIEGSAFEEGLLCHPRIKDFVELELLQGFGASIGPVLE